jgi:WD40 repeat protein
VGAVQFSPDGKWLVSGGGDRIIRVWNLVTGKSRHELKGPGGFTCSVRISPDGKTLVAAGYESGGASCHPIHRWDLPSGQGLPSLAGHPGGIRRMAFTPDGKYLVSGGFDGTVRIWDLANGKEKRLIRAHGGAVYGLAITRDGKTLASGGVDGVRVWDLASGRERTSGPLTRNETLAVAFAPCGRMLASGERDVVRFWELATGKEIQSLRGFKSELSYMVFSSDGRTLLSSSYDRAVRLWEVRTGKLIRKLDGHESWVWGLDLSPDEKSVASCGFDGKLLCWDMKGLCAPAPKKTHLTRRQLDDCWADLAAADAGRAYQAVWALAADPKRSIPLLRKHLDGQRKADALTPAKVTKLLAGLDADEFDEREQASEALEKAGTQVEPMLRRALPKAPSLEARRRMEKLLALLHPGTLSAEELTVIRAVQVLEYTGTRESRRLLERFAQEAPGLRLTEEAAQAVIRLTMGGDKP